VQLGTTRLRRFNSGITKIKEESESKAHHNASDVEHDSNEGRIQSPGTREPHATGMSQITRITNSQVVSNSRARTNLNDDSSPRKVEDVASPLASRARLPTMQLGRLAPRTPVRHTSQEEEDEEFEHEITAYEIMQGIYKPRGPADYALLDIYKPQPSSPRPRPATTSHSSPLRSAEMLALATANGNGGAAAGDRSFNRVAMKAVQKALQGAELGQAALRWVIGTLCEGWKLTRASCRTLAHFLRTAIPATLATIGDVLTAEKTPEGSNHAPIPGAYSIMVKVPETAAQATSIDHVGPKPASRQHRPQASRLQYRPTPSKGPTLAEMRASEESSAKARPRSLLREQMSPRSLAAFEKWKAESERKQKFSALRRQPPSVQGPLDPGRAKQQALSQSENQPAQQLDCLGPYWAKRLSPFLGADGKELPMFKLNQDQLEICRSLVQKVDPSYYLQAAVMLVRDDGETLVAMRIEVGPSPSSDDRGLLTAGSSDNGSTWDFVNATNERGDPTQVLYASESHKDSAHLQNASSSFSTTNGWNSSISFLLRDKSAVKGSLLCHEDYGMTLVLEDGSMLDGALVQCVVEYDSPMDVDESMTDAFD
jgi:hypothetical protein